LINRGKSKIFKQQTTRLVDMKNVKPNTQTKNLKKESAKYAQKAKKSRHSKYITDTAKGITVGQKHKQRFSTDYGQTRQKNKRLSTTEKVPNPNIFTFSKKNSKSNLDDGIRNEELNFVEDKDYIKTLSDMPTDSLASPTSQHRETLFSTYGESSANTKLLKSRGNSKDLYSPPDTKFDKNKQLNKYGTVDNQTDFPKCFQTPPHNGSKEDTGGNNLNYDSGT